MGRGGCDNQSVEKPVEEFGRSLAETGPQLGVSSSAVAKTISQRNTKENQPLPVELVVCRRPRKGAKELQRIFRQMKIRISKHDPPQADEIISNDINSNDQNILMMQSIPEKSLPQVWNLGHSNFGFVSDFGIRIPNLWTQPER